MKIHGPTSGPPAPATDDSKPATGVSPTAKAFGEKLAGTSKPSAPAPVIDGDIAAGLRSGKLNASTAVEQVVERVLDRQLGANAPAEVREQVRAALRDALEGDPLLQEKVRRLAAGS